MQATDTINLVRSGVRLLISRNCPHCNSLIQICLDIIKSGGLSRLEIINIENPPADLDTKNIRTVPIMIIDGLSFTGVHTREEILYWIQNAANPKGIEKYIDDQLKTGNLNTIRELLSQHPDYYMNLINLLGNTETALHTRIGISALLEEIAGTEILRRLFSSLAKLTQHKDANIRGDACYLLSLTEMEDARKYLEARISDPDASVREIATEGLVNLS